MRIREAKAILREALAPAGIGIDGRRPWDLRVLNEEFYPRVLAGGTLAVGDSYVDGWWEADRLDEFFHRAFKAGLYSRFAGGFRTRLAILAARLWNLQSRRRAHEVADRHYNLGNDLFRAMLDRRMNYTCAYWNGARDLDEAQEAKLELVCRKLELRPGMSVLEYGCGWGAFARYAAERHGARVLAVNIAEEQVRLARELCAGLPVEVRLADYREVRGKFDRVVSIGILEHVGPRNHRTYMEHAASCLNDDGIAFVHTIAQNTSEVRADPWFDRRIFPNGVTPSAKQLGAALEGLFVLENLHNIGPHYDSTLLAWHENLTLRWPSLREKYDDRLYRTLKFYLLSSAGSFRSRRSQVFQLVLTKPGRRQPECRMPPAPRLEPAAREVFH